MNVFTEMRAIERLAVALEIMESRNATWNEGMSLNDHVKVKLAVDAALKLLRDDIISKAI